MARPLRHTFILILVALGTCLAAVSGWRYARASAPVNGPIVLVSIEALRPDHLPAYGYRQGKTPAIDTLAADGVVFERAYSHIPQTLPAHASLLTGRLPFETGVRDSVGIAVPQTERLLPEMLRDRGYATGGVVSSFLLRKETGIDQGFSFFDDGGPSSGDGAPRGLSRDGVESERVAEHWLDSVGTSRAFLFLQVDGPREPSGSSEPLAQVAAYDAAITSADETVGQLLHYLKTHQLYDQSTVILVADHGQGLGEHGERTHGLFIYNEALRVPLIIKPPAEEGAGRRIRTVVQHVDLVPTILDLAKAPIPGNLHGRSLTRLLEGNESSTPDATVYAESQFASYHFGWSGLTSLTDGHYHYISAPREELYDLDGDPQELTNLSGLRPDIVGPLRARLRALVSVAAPVSLGPVSDDERERYESLGYVGVVTEPMPPTSEPIDPKDKREVVEQYRSAVARDAAQDSKAAIEQFLALTRQEPAMRDVWLRLGSTAARAERFDIGVDAFKHAIQLAPGKADGYLGAASALLHLRMFDAARQHAQRVADDDSLDHASQSAAHALLADIALSRHDADLARSEAALAEDLDETWPVRALVDGRIAFEQRRYAEALDSFEPALLKVRKGTARLGDLGLYTAEALLHVDRLTEAEPLFLEELKRSPVSPRARAGLMTLYRATGRTADATALSQH